MKSPPIERQEPRIQCMYEMILIYRSTSLLVCLLLVPLTNLIGHGTADIMVMQSHPPIEIILEKLCNVIDARQTIWTKVIHIKSNDFPVSNQHTMIPIKGCQPYPHFHKEGRSVSCCAHTPEKCESNFLVTETKLSWSHYLRTRELE